MITTYKKDSMEYRKLEAVALLLTLESPTGVDYRVGDCYFDFGQNWMWTTIIARRKDGSSWQAIYPNEHDAALLAESSEDIVKVVEHVLNYKYSPDRLD